MFSVTHAIIHCQHSLASMCVYICVQVQHVMIPNEITTLVQYVATIATYRPSCVASGS